MGGQRQWRPMCQLELILETKNILDYGTTYRPRILASWPGVSRYCQLGCDLFQIDYKRLIILQASLALKDRNIYPASNKNGASCCS